MAHPQNSHRGFFSKSRLHVGGSTGVFAVNYSIGTAALTWDSTGDLSAVAGVLPSAKSTAKISGNDTGIVLESGASATLKTAAGTAQVLAANSTGLTIGGAQISTA